MCPIAPTKVLDRQSPEVRASFRASLVGRAAAVLGCFGFAVSLMSATGSALAAEFRSVGVAAAVLYDGPSTKGRKLFVAPRGMPLEVLSTVNQWVKVRDQAGDVVWIERSDLGAQRTVVTTVTASVKAAAQDSAANSFQVERGVVLEWLDPAASPQWLRVKHRDGSTGFVKAAEVWGY